jgi:hypothetical protein
MFQRTLFACVWQVFLFYGNIMNTRPKRWCWRKDLSEFRGLTDRERAGFLLLLEWFENWRLRHELSAGREAAARFWKEEVRREGREREGWQLEQWGHAMQWYLKWLEACTVAGGDHHEEESFCPSRRRGRIMRSPHPVATSE